MLEFMRSRRAFTLVEILVAVAILALLAAIAVPVVLHMRGSSKTTAADTELKDVQSAVDNMMTFEEQVTLSDPVAVATSNMAQFPDWDGATGYVLVPTGAHLNSTTNIYIRPATTHGTYTCDAQGNVTQASYP